MATDQRAPDSPVNDYLRTIRRRGWWIAATALIVVVAAGLYSYSETKVYTAQATVEVLGGTSGSKGNVDTDAALVTSTWVKQLVSKDLGVTPPPPATASASGTTSLIAISVANSSPIKAATIANDYAKAFIQVMGEQQQTSVNSQIADNKAEVINLQSNEVSLEKVLDAVPAGQPLSPTENVDKATLQQDIQTVISVQSADVALQAQLEKAGSTVQQTSVANPPKSPSSPKTSRDLGLGLVVGLILGLVLAFVVDAFDDSVRSEADIDRTCPEMPHLGVIPIVDSWNDVSSPYVVSLQAPRNIVSEAYRSLRTAVEFTRLNQSVRTLVVTSSVGLEGKTSTVANLGVTFARSGKKTLVLSGDLRRPRLGSFLGLQETVGLTSIALGVAGVEDAIQPVVDVAGLYFLGTGPLPDGAAEFLSSPRLQSVLSDLRERFDVVLIDAPPVLPVTDAVVMSRYADGVVLVVAQNRTRRRSLAKLRRVLSQVDAPVIGSVLNGAAIKRSDSYYGYYGYYGHAEKKPDTGQGRETAATHFTSRSNGSGSGRRGSEKVRTRV
ncbi:MAG: polysaccharide biosynthesis tyrosine autokinase [Acidimicrobiales bacterium]